LRISQREGGGFRVFIDRGGERKEKKRKEKKEVR